MSVRERLDRGLVELAAGRDPGALVPDQALIDAALEHRMTGLLCSHLQQRGDADLQVAMLDLRIQAHQAAIAALLQRCLDAASDVGTTVVVLKGASIEHRCYGRSGERPSSDVDLWMHPDAPADVVALVDRLQPEHPWLPALESMIRRHEIQSVTLQVDGLEVDVHVDPLKLGVWTRHTDQAWATTRTLALPDGTAIRVLDDDWTMLLLLVHLSKDRFQRLLGYADVVRMDRHTAVDWSRVRAIARAEGIEHLVVWAVGAVEDDLDVHLVGAGVREVGRPLRRWVWHRLWRQEIRLRGREGRRRFRFRQDLLPLLADGRRIETLRWWIREVFPPAAAVAAEYPDEPGPYLRRLLAGRLHATRARRASERQREVAAS